MPHHPHHSNCYVVTMTQTQEAAIQHCKGPVGTENLGLGRSPGLVFPFPAPLLLAGVTGPAPGPLEVQVRKQGWGKRL